MREQTRILIVSNSRTEAAHYKAILAGMEAEACAVNNSSDAIRLFNARFARKQPFDLVIASYLLSGKMTGPSLVKIFLNVYPPLKIMFFPSAELYDRETNMECREIAASIIMPDFSTAGLRRIVDRVRKEIEI